MPITVIIEIPFMYLSFFVGPVAKYFGTDVTILVSLVVPWGLYYVANRKLILPSHMRLSNDASSDTV
jgi:purine-cytosine permease-like protein